MFVMIKQTVIAFFLLVSTIFGYAQKDVPFDKLLFTHDKEGFEEATKSIKLGDFYFFDGRDDYLSTALSHFLDAQQFNPHSSILNYKIGICYLYSNEKTKSLPYLKFAYSTNPQLDNDLTFYLAQSYHINSNYQEAITFYKQYQASIKSSNQNQHLFLAKKIKEAENGIELTQHPVNVWIDNLGDSINSEFSEFSPVISADNKMLFFTTRRPTTTATEKKEKQNTYYEDIYFAKRNAAEDWSLAQNIGVPINTQSHDATVGLSPDGKSLLTYKGISANNGDILIAKQNEDGTWQSPQTFGSEINTKYHESSATLSFDEKTLFFVSDRPGGYGQHDIYTTTWNDKTNKWNPTKNMGATINTEFEEKGVFYHANTRTLYFSSNGHQNIGGLDIFKTTFDQNTQRWSNPINIGTPINTPDDDIYFVVTGNGRYAYYSSNKPGGYGEKDLYKVTFLGPKKEGDFALPPLYNSANLSSAEKFIEIKAKPAQFMLTGSVKNGTNQKGIPAKIYIVNAETNQKIKEINTLPDGSYAVLLSPNNDYAITAGGSQLTIDSKTIKGNPANENKEIEMDFELFLPTADELNLGHSFTLRNIYFDFDQSDLAFTAFNSQSQVELDLLAEFMKENPTITIELSGHTDSRGEASYNLELSGKRALISKQYLIEKGINGNRIKASGYGEYRPEIDDSAIKQLKSKEEKEAAHQRNRRTVITILTE